MSEVDNVKKLEKKIKKTEDDLDDLNIRTMLIQQYYDSLQTDYKKLKKI